MGWCLLCGVLVAACVAAAVRRRSGSARKRALVQLCADAGIVYSVVDPSDTTLLPFGVFGSQSAHGGENVVSDEHDGRGIRVFDLWVQTRPDESRRTMTCAVVPLPSRSRGSTSSPGGRSIRQPNRSQPKSSISSSTRSSNGSKYARQIRVPRSRCSING